MLRKVYLNIMFRIQMVEAYLAFHRGEYIAAAEYENQARQYESEMQRLEVLSCR